MGWKIRDDYRDYDRFDPDTGESPPKATSLSRVLGVYQDGTSRVGDERIFLAGADVPDNYMSDKLVQRFEDGDEAVLAIFEKTGDDSEFSKLNTEQLDAALAERGLVLTEGSGSNKSVVKKDKVAALENFEATRPAGSPTSTVVEPTVSPDNPFSS